MEEYKNKKLAAVMLALFFWVGPAFDTIPEIIRPFTGYSSYVADLVISGNATNWEMVDARGKIFLSYRDGETYLNLTSFEIDFEHQYNIADGGRLQPNGECECTDSYGNFWYVFLPSSSFKSPFTGIALFAGYTLIVVAAAVGYTWYAKKKYVNGATEFF